MVTRFESNDGRLSFRQFMDLALHEPDHGAYGSGHLKVGPQGDFVTSPSMGSEFAALLSIQVMEWLDQIHAKAPEAPLTLVEMGPGEGHLAADLWDELQRLNPAWFGQLQLVLVETNGGMEVRQRKRLAAIPAQRIRWTSIEALHTDPIRGVVVAHEVLDAFSVERLMLRDGTLRQMGVVLETTSDGQPWLQWDDQPLPDHLQKQLDWAQQRCSVALPPDQAEEGWTTEWHDAVAPWLDKASAAVEEGVLLIVDYALEARRYYSPRRWQGTLLSYRQQQASSDLLADAGLRDLTAHLCIDTLCAQAEEQGWSVLGHCRQGEALLALGLSQRLHCLQALPAGELAEALQRRETLLRLVDPAGLGDFRWIALARSNQRENAAVFTSRCLEAPAEFI
ncbi:MAG: SAM-dependent methyltransferase [Synechococcus sp.]|nr:SAM-dependent methyltransferase [Synechococcus sp.]